LCIPIILPPIEAQEKGCLASPYIPNLSEDIGAINKIPDRHFAPKNVADRGLCDFKGGYGFNAKTVSALAKTINPTARTVR
jgi:hypothetical protein